MPMFKLTGQESTITLHLEHPIHLHDDFEYSIALSGFYSENNISNLPTDGYLYFLISPKPNGLKALRLERGYWTLEKIQEKCRELIKSLNHNPTEFIITKASNQLTVSICSPLEFSFDVTIAKLLGFDIPSYDNYFKPGKPITATRPPNLRGLDTVEIQCNLVENSYSSHDEHSHKHQEHRILYTFFPAVPWGYKISETPHERFYIPLERGLRKIQQITVVLADQDSEQLHNPFVNNILYLHLKKK